LLVQWLPTSVRITDEDSVDTLLALEAAVHHVRRTAHSADGICKSGVPDMFGRLLTLLEIKEKEEMKYTSKALGLEAEGRQKNDASGVNEDHDWVMLDQENNSDVEEDNVLATEELLEQKEKDKQRAYVRDV